MEYLVIAFALLFLLFAIRALMNMASIAEPIRSAIEFAYCLIVALYLLVHNRAFF